MNKSILVINYRMDSEDPIFSHQIEVVDRLSSYFDSIHVVTSKVGKYSLNKDIKIHDVDWKSGSFLMSVLNIWNFYRKIIPIIFKSRPDVIFSHMTEKQSALIAPLIFFTRTKHYLWYAHSSKNFILFWNNLFIDGFISSTKGSFPYNFRKLYLIGQGIDSKVFTFHANKEEVITKFIHIGRMDFSKKVHEIIKCLKIIREDYPNIELTLVGNPSNEKQTAYANEVLSIIQSGSNSEWMKHKKSVVRSEIPRLFSNFGTFIHAFKGSLDKVLIEATLSGLHVVTTNSEFISIFGKWDKGNSDIELKNEVLAFLKFSKLERERERIRRFNIAIRNHSLENWVSQLISILTGNIE